MMIATRAVQADGQTLYSTMIKEDSCVMVRLP